MKRAHSPCSRGKKQGSPKKATTTRSITWSSAVISLDAIVSVPALFEQIVGNLHWKDVLALGSVNFKYYKACQELYDTIFDPVLDVLESLCRSNFHEDCGKVDAPECIRDCMCSAATVEEAKHLPENQALAAIDPRHEETYASLPMQAKCAKMVQFLTTLVINMRPHLNYVDPANFHNMPDALVNLGGWVDGSRDDEILMLYPRRAALALNVALIAYAQDAMKAGGLAL